MKSIFEEMGGIYRQEGDYLIPNIKLPEQEEYQLGKYGRMRRNFLKEHHPARYSDLHSGRTALESPGRNRQALQCPHGSDDSCYEKNRKVSQKP